MPDHPAAYPAVDFYFQLALEGLPATHSTAFQEVSGISVALEAEDTRAGLNTNKHRPPAPAKYSNLVLKRGFMSPDSEVAKWLSTTIDGDFSRPITPHNVQLSLCSAAGVALAIWEFEQAWPVAWSVSEFKSPDGALAVEKLELAYTSFVRR